MMLPGRDVQQESFSDRYENLLASKVSVQITATSGNGRTIRNVGVEGARAVPLNLGRIGANAAKPLLEPRAIYAALPNKPWPYLRHEQGEVLERWFTRRDDQDIVIKQNTGGGKTVVGLLIAQSTLNEKIGPAVYLAPDRYLVSYVRSEAARLGIHTANSYDDAAFRAGEAIFVTTFHKLINGKSVFGVAGDGREVPKLGIVVVDDAHAALATTEGQFRLTIPSNHIAYRQLVGLFEKDLAEQSKKIWGDICDGDYVAVLRIPFWAWRARQGDVFQILHPRRHDDELKFEWPLVGDVLPLCFANVSSHAVEIRPPCPPIKQIPAFTRARRRVYLTATLADDSILITDLDADPEQVKRPVTPGSAADLGERMILAPVELNPKLDEIAVRDLARQFANGDRDGDGIREAKPINVVVLVPSDKAAERWLEQADHIYHVGDLEQGVAQLRAGHVGLVVLVNKYDGVDLPRDACRLLILDGIPRAFDAAERREAAALAGSPGLLARQVQRVEQGMGRAVRDAEDYCAVLLLGSELAFTLHDPRYRALLSPATQAQVALSREVAAQIRGEGIHAIRDALGACLARDAYWVRASRRAVADVQYAQRSIIRPTAVATRKAFDLAAFGRYEEAATASARRYTMSPILPNAAGWASSEPPTSTTSTLAVPNKPLPRL
jgi:hypothetical protein